MAWLEFHGRVFGQSHTASMALADHAMDRNQEEIGSFPERREMLGGGVGTFG